jgi:NAD-dependent deacetylase
VYHPQELATWATFERDPELVWPWYLWRRSVCRAAAPNAAHRALAALDGALGDRFRLVTQNVDGLHRRAGSPPARTWAIHGDIDGMRCAAECGAPMAPVPDEAGAATDPYRLAPAVRALLRCGRCGGWMRPHVLWFDESYDEPRYRFDSALAAARDAALLLVVGTTGSTNLPVLMGRAALHAGAWLLDVNPADSPFGAAAERAGRGLAVRGTATEVVPDVVAHLTAAARTGREPS